MFHHGHMRFLENCKKRFQHVHLIVGVVSDEDLQLNDKGVIIMSQKERSDAVMYCKWVD
jgi:cytidyltransferase-like protein